MSPRSDRKARPAVRRGLLLEELENRTLLSASGLAALHVAPGLSIAANARAEAPGQIRQAEVAPRAGLHVQAQGSVQVNFHAGAAGRGVALVTNANPGATVLPGTISVIVILNGQGAPADVEHGPVQVTNPPGGIIEDVRTDTPAPPPGGGIVTPTSPGQTPAASPTFPGTQFTPAPAVTTPTPAPAGLAAVPPTAQTAAALAARTDLLLARTFETPAAETFDEGAADAIQLSDGTLTFPAETNRDWWMNTGGAAEERETADPIFRLPNTNRPTADAGIAPRVETVASDGIVIDLTGQTEPEPAPTEMAAAGLPVSALLTDPLGLLVGLAAGMGLWWRERGKRPSGKHVPVGLARPEEPKI